MFKDSDNYSFFFYGILITIVLIFSLIGNATTSKEIPDTTKPQLYNPQKPVLCDAPDKIIDIIKSYDENPYLKFNGVSPSSDGQYLKTIIIFGFNKETESWSLVEFINDTTACIIGNGRGIQLVEQSFNLGT